MARVTTVEKSRKSPGKCGRCGKVIEAGSRYFHWSNRAPGSRGGFKSIRCGDHYPRGSETVGSPYRRAAYGAQEDAEDVLNGEWDFSDLAEALRSAAETVQSECADALNEAADNIEDGFGHETYQSSELRERASAFEEWAQELESAADDIDGFGDMDSIADDCEVEGCEHDADCAAYEAARDEAQSTAEQALVECPE